MNRKERREYYKKHPEMKKAVKEQTQKSIEQLKQAFQKKWDRENDGEKTRNKR